MFSSYLDTLRTRLRSFAGARGGNVAVMFALSFIPLLGFIGMAVDYTHATSDRAAVQAALDSATLMLSKDVGNLTEQQRKDKAHDYFFALLNRNDKDLAVTVKDPEYSAADSQLKLTVSGSVKTKFMPFLYKFGCAHCDTVNFESSSTVRWGNTRLRVALALDNTGSMADDGKMDALKSATTNLINSLKNAATKDGDVYVSIIPFSRDVNADPKNYAESWINWTDWDQWSKDCADNYDSSRSSQRTAAATACGGSFVDTIVNGSHKWVWTIDHSKWNGCVKDRGPSSKPGDSPKDYDANNATPDTAHTSSLFMAEQYGSCSVPLLPLTYKWDDLKTKVTNMTPAGNTNQTIGLQWAWQSLTDGNPFNPPAIVNDGIPTRKIIILLTDGLNTQNRWSSTQSTIDARTKLACENAKKDVVLYTVQVNTGGDPLSTMLQNCPSKDTDEPKGPKFFHLTKADQVVTTFDQIGTQLSKLRISK